MGKSERTRWAERRGDLVVWSDGTKVVGVEVVQLPNKEVNVVWRYQVVLLKIIQSDERKSHREIPPEDVNGRARVLGGSNDMNDGILKGKGRGNVDMNNDQGVAVKSGAPLKVMKCTKEKGGAVKPASSTDNGR